MHNRTPVESPAPRATHARRSLPSIALYALLLGSGPAIVRAQPPAPTPPYMPPEAVSNEANAKQLADARQQGDAYGQAVRWECSGAAWCSERRAGDLHLTAALSPAEGGWHLEGGALRWHEPQAGTLHLRIFAADNGDDRFVPGASVQVRLLDADGRLLAQYPLPAGIYPLTDAYGSDLPIPAVTRSLVVTVEPLPWRRHDPYNGDRYSHPTVSVFRLDRIPSPSGEAASARAENAPPALKDALNRALDHTIKAMWKQANDGAARRAGDYDIGYAVEYAEAYWEFHREHFRYAIENENSAHFNAHVEVVPRDALSGNFLAGMKVTATLSGPDGPVAPPVDDHGTGGPAYAGNVPLMWHSWLYHYGQNWRVPGAGRYRLHVHIAPPTAIRYGRRSGKRMAAPVDVTFQQVHIKTGQK